MKTTKPKRPTRSGCRFERPPIVTRPPQSSCFIYHARRGPQPTPTDSKFYRTWSKWRVVARLAGACRHRPFICPDDAIVIGACDFRRLSMIKCPLPPHLTGFRNHPETCGARRRAGLENVRCRSTAKHIRTRLGFPRKHRVGSYEPCAWQ